jgi:hypothetical protein
MRSIIFCSTALLACVLSGGPEPTEAAGGAYAVDDAAIGKPGSCQNETWLSTATIGDFVAVVSPACVVAIGIPVEFAALVQRGRTNESWAATGGLQIKAVPIDTDYFAIGWAFGAGKDFTLQRINYATGGVGFDWDFAPRFALMGEVSIQAGQRIEPRTVTEPRAQLGLRAMPTPTVDIDLIYGRNITGSGGSWLTLGLTVRSK